MQGFDVDKDLYFMSKEVAGIKKSLTGLSHSMTGAKGDIDGLKAAVSVTAASAQLLKVDLSLWKIDEKGITFRGHQKFLWESHREEKKKKEEADKEKEKALERKMTGYYPLEKAREMGKKVEAIGKSNDAAHKEIKQLRASLKTAGESSAVPPGSNKRKQFNDVRNSVKELSEALAGL